MRAVGLLSDGRLMDRRPVGSSLDRRDLEPEPPSLYWGLVSRTQPPPPPPGGLAISPARAVSPSPMTPGREGGMRRARGSPVAIRGGRCRFVFCLPTIT